MIYIFCIITIAALFTFAAYQFYTYQNSAYHRNTGNPYLSVLLDAGRNGEYQTYKKLRRAEKSGGRFLFNAYLPKGDGETTEADVVLIWRKGVVVFESKNYSGWIFGNERDKMWTQTLPQGKGKSRKEHFLNPILQNRLHIRCIQELIGPDVPIYSVVVFSERCELKRVEVSQKDVRVVKRGQVLEAVSQIADRSELELSQDEIDKIYETLHPYTQVSDAVKAAHIERIRQQHDDPEEKAPDHNHDDLKEKAPGETPDHSHDTQKRICPRCGAELRVRTARRGDNKGKRFWGCSEYPKCRYIEEIE